MMPRRSRFSPPTTLPRQETFSLPTTLPRQETFSLPTTLPRWEIFSPPTTNTAQVGELTPAEAGTAQPSTSGTQPNDPMAQMLLMMQKTFDEQLKFQREQQKCQDSQLPPLEKVPEIDWTHNDGTSQSLYYLERTVECNLQKWLSICIRCCKSA